MVIILYDNLSHGTQRPYWSLKRKPNQTWLVLEHFPVLAPGNKPGNTQLHLIVIGPVPCSCLLCLVLSVYHPQLMQLIPLQLSSRLSIIFVVFTFYLFPCNFFSIFIVVTKDIIIIIITIITTVLLLYYYMHVGFSNLMQHKLRVSNFH